MYERFQLRDVVVYNLASTPLWFDTASLHLRMQLLTTLIALTEIAVVARCFGPG